MSNANELHTQCLYQDLSNGVALGTACSSNTGGVVNVAVIVNVDDGDDNRFKEYEELAESIEDTPYVTSNTQQAIPYFVCEQYCSNDSTCLGFVPDYSYGQESTFINSRQQVQYNSVRCILARNASPDDVTMDATNGLTIPAPCFTKLEGRCLKPNEATVDLSTTMCDACSELISGGDSCFWCEPIVTSFFQSSTAQPGKCVCQASMLLPSSLTGSAGTTAQTEICDLLLPHNNGSPVEYKGTYSNLSNTTTLNNITNSCRSSIEIFRSEYGSATDSINNNIGGLAVSSVIVVAVVVSIAIPCCICCCVVYLCCFRNKDRRPGHGGGGGNAGSSLPSHNANANNNHAMATTTTNNNNTTTYAPTQHPHQQNSNYTMTNNNHYSTSTPVEAVQVEAGTAAAVGYRPEPYTNANTNDSERSSGYDHKPIHHSYSNLEPVPAPSSNPNYNNSNPNGADYNNDYDDGVPIAVPTGGDDNMMLSTSQQQGQHYQQRPMAPHAGEPIMVRVVSPCDMDEGYRFGASHEGQQFEIAAPKGGLRAGQEIIVSVPKPDQMEADVHQALPIARPVVD
jgi:hypothetical protein